MTTRLGRKRRRTKVHRSSGNREIMMTLIGLLTGSRKEAVSAIKVQANRCGRTGNRSLVTRTYTIGVKIRAVASLESTIQIKDPPRKTLTKTQAPLFPPKQ